MTITIIITLCSLLLLAYVFDISSPFTKIPSVILLLLLGWVFKQVIGLFPVEIPDLSKLLPIFGTIGLILIVMEGALELELNKSKLKVLKKSMWIALIPILVSGIIIGLAFHYYGGVPFLTALINAIPFCVISSSIAIPSVRNLNPADKEFVIYESSFSDIIGVLVFNFLAINTYVNLMSFGQFGLQLVVIISISFLSVIGLSFLLSRIKHHITYTPIILLVLLIYGISKVFHLPGLLFILVFGLFLGNLDELKRFAWVEKLRPEKLDKEVLKFKEITIEATFLIRALFFMLFGYLMESKEILNPETILWAAAIVAIVLIIRMAVLKLFKLPLNPLLFVAPRGLITILLFLSILPAQHIFFVNNSLVIQTIVISVLAMMFGLLISTNKKNL